MSLNFAAVGGGDVAVTVVVVLLLSVIAIALESGTVEYWTALVPASCSNENAAAKHWGAGRISQNTDIALIIRLVT